MQVTARHVEDSRQVLRVPTPARRAAGTASHDAPVEVLAAWREAYLHRGGLVSGEVVVGLLRGHIDHPLSQLARWIVAGDVISVDDHSNTLIPLFQFDPVSMSIRDDVREVVAELAPVLESGEMAGWFVQPNDWLAGELPVDVIDRDLAAVIQAARADRFVATGWA